MTDNWHMGNANEDGDAHRGWILGHFLNPPEGIRATAAVEVKWGVHPAGEARPQWSRDEQRTTLAILVSGRFRVDLSVSSVLLQRQGDYVVWGPGVDHSWLAEEDSVVVTVRWPSLGSRERYRRGLLRTRGELAGCSPPDRGSGASVARGMF